MSVSHPLCILIFTNCWCDLCSASFCRMKSVSSFHCVFTSKSLSSSSGLARSSGSSERFWGWNNKTHSSSFLQSNQAIHTASVEELSAPGSPFALVSSTIRNKMHPCNAFGKSLEWLRFLTVFKTSLLLYSLIMNCWMIFSLRCHSRSISFYCIFIFLWKPLYVEFFMILWWIGSSKEQDLFETKMCCTTLNVFKNWLMISFVHHRNELKCIIYSNKKKLF